LAHTVTFSSGFPAFLAYPNWAETFLAATLHWFVEQGGSHAILSTIIPIDIIAG
jgi:hypothetical protein